MKYITEERFIVTSNDKEARRKYAENYDRIFGEKGCDECSCPHGDANEPANMHDSACPAKAVAPKDADAIEMRFVTITHFCKVCEALVPDPENHQHHAVINEPVYYAHPIWFYDTDDERADVEEIARQLGGVLNPNAPEHNTGYRERKARTGNGMDYFYEDVLPGCRACVFRADRDGRISSGVAGEVSWFIERGRPVYEIVDGALVPAGLDPTRVMSIEESRRRCGK